MNCEACEGKGTRPITENERALIAKDAIWYFIFDKISSVGFAPMEEWPCEKCHGAGFIDKPAECELEEKKISFLRVIK